MKRRRLAQVLGAIAVIAGGIIAPNLLSRLRPGTLDIEPEHVLPAVTTVMPSVHGGRLTIRGYGTVRPLREITLIAEVAGRITWVAEAFVSGGAFHRGDELLRIDSTEYANAVIVARAEVVQRQFDLLRAEEEMTIARQEWTLLENRRGVQRQEESTELGSLVFREPQQKAAAAQLRSARAHQDDAEARLKRTRIAAPFNGRVRGKSADVGQFVGPGQVVASYYGTDAAEIDVPVAGRDVALLGDLLMRRAAPARARIVGTSAGGRKEWEGVVHRTEGALTESTRSLNAVVRVYRPYESSDERPPLLIGTFVTAYLEGKHLDLYYTLPRESLREGGAVWVVSAGRLYARPIEIIQEVEDTLYVLGGITEADSVVTSVLDAVADGMRVRTAAE